MDDKSMNWKSKSKVKAKSKSKSKSKLNAKSESERESERESELAKRTQRVSQGISLMWLDHLSTWYLLIDAHMRFVECWRAQVGLANPRLQLFTF